MENVSVFLEKTNQQEKAIPIPIILKVSVSNTIVANTDYTIELWEKNHDRWMV